ncbi:MAG: M28 family peptidase [Bacteroidota bacterium]|nr:M28 family peptidase [Bacteroidota bacterium]
MNVPLILCTALITICTIGTAQTNRNTAPPALSSIKEADLKKDLYEMASDHFAGREAGTLDELKVSMWWANKLRTAGLKPAGDDGTYFQFFSLKRNRIAASSTVAIGNDSLQLWNNVLVATTTPAKISAPVVFAGNGSKAELDKADVRGKAVAIQASPEGLNLKVSLWERRYMGYILNKFRNDLINRGAAAIVFITDAQGEQSWNQGVPAMQRGLYDIEGGPNVVAPKTIPVFWLHGSNIDLVKNSGSVLNATINVDRFDYPSVNIIGKIEGTDKELSKEYVLFSGHQDHDGVRMPYGTDSIYNGADDNATVSVALLAIARAFKANPGRRSALFVWHGAEERGLLGSRWYASHPTVAKESIVAVLNGDMIGRNTPDSAALLGAQSPHKNSSELVAMAMQSNNEGPKFKLDTLWDKPTHVEGWYFRSDHLPYARAGYPAIFFTTLLHPDYHTPMDEASRIDYSKLKRMTDWMYRTGWKVANTTKKPALEPNFKLER